MPDIRTVLQAMSVDDRALWSECRTNMRRAFLTAHNHTVGMQNWDVSDDMFMDLIDINLALLFDRSGRLESTTEVVSAKDAEKIMEKIEEAGQNVGKAKAQPEMSEASKKLADGWGK